MKTRPVKLTRRGPIQARGRTLKTAPRVPANRGRALPLKTPRSRATRGRRLRSQAHSRNASTGPGYTLWVGKTRLKSGEISPRGASPGGLEASVSSRANRTDVRLSWRVESERRLGCSSGSQAALGGGWPPGPSHCKERAHPRGEKDKPHPASCLREGGAAAGAPRGPTEARSCGGRPQNRPRDHTRRNLTGLAWGRGCF